LIHPLGLTFDEFAAVARAAAPDSAGLAPALYRRLFQGGGLDPVACGAAARHRAAWRSAFADDGLALVDRIEEDGALGATVKLAFQTRDGERIESVAIPMPGGKYSLCLSSQAGCARACAFCETGGGGLRRDLSAAEIVGQVVAAGSALGRRFRNLVFMGMGEPLDNFEQVVKAIVVLGERRGLAYAKERLTICTCGPEGGLRALAALGWKRLNLAISLNSARDEVRDRLMPVNRSTPLAALTAALAEYPKRPNFFLAVNYCLLPGINDAPADVAAVAAFCAAVGRTMVNLIPYNPGSRPLAPAPTDEQVDAFIAALTAADVAVRRRAAKGARVMAACGQLGGPAAGLDTIA
jgi:23S rRNA (adenine2503-C2)-methyltransferase